MNRTRALTGAVLVAGVLGAVTSAAPPAPPAPAGRGQAPAATPRSVAPTDFTGNWVSVITEDWRFRMVAPPVGDVGSVPVSNEGRMTTQSFDPARDVAAGEQCKAYGAAGIMRMPTRLRISWENDTTLKVETDAGTQVRLFQFGNVPAPAGGPQWQGHSVARWETMAEGQGQPGGGGGRGGAPALSGALRVVTTNLRPAYLQRNGVPYSSRTVLTESFDVVSDNADRWLILTTAVTDPVNLAQPYTTTTHFKKEPDGSKWSPRPCEVSQPIRGRG